MTWQRTGFVTRRSRVRIPEQTLESLRNSHEQGINTQLLKATQPSRSSEGRQKWGAALRHQLACSLGSLAPSQGTRSISWCQAVEKGDQLHPTQWALRSLRVVVVVVVVCLCVHCGNDLCTHTLLSLKSPLLPVSHQIVLLADIFHVVALVVLGGLWSGKYFFVYWVGQQPHHKLWWRIRLQPIEIFYMIFTEL